MKTVTVAGAGMTNFGELWDKDLRTLAREASLAAINDSGFSLEEIDAIYVANMGSSSFTGQDHLGSLIASELGLFVPAMRLEAACASGGVAINAARTTLLAGTFKTVLVVGVEKMTDVDTSEVTKGLSRAADEEYEAFCGATFPSLYAMMARAYMQKYKLTRRQLALVSVKNHEHGLKHERAQFQKAITVADVLAASPVAEPLGLLDCSPVSDGAAAVVLTGSRQHGLAITASQVATGTISLHARQSFTSIEATKRAAAAAYKEAGCSAAEIGLAEVHDCFSISEIMAYEDLGFTRAGTAAKLLESGHVSASGRLPVNTSGGLKSCGHPVGATGVKQLVELYEQMQGKAGKRQLGRTPGFGLAHNVGGSGGTAVVTIVKHV